MLLYDLYLSLWSFTMTNRLWWREVYLSSQMTHSDWLWRVIDVNKTSDILRVLFSLVFAAQTSGNSAGMAPDYGQAVLAARRIMKLLRHPTIIDPASKEGKTSEITGHIEFAGVEFAYPTRTNTLVLKGKGGQNPPRFGWVGWLEPLSANQRPVSIAPANQRRLNPPSTPLYSPRFCPP